MELACNMVVLSNVQRLNIEKNRVAALVRRKELFMIRNFDCFKQSRKICAECYIWPRWSESLSTDLSDEEKKTLRDRWEAVESKRINVPREGLEDNDESIIVVVWGKGGFSTAGVYSSWKEAKQYCYNVQYANYWKVLSFEDGWEVMDALYKGVKSFISCRELLYVHAPSILTNLDVHYAPLALRLPPPDIMARYSLVRSHAFTWHHPNDEELAVSRDEATTLGRSRKGREFMFFAADYAVEAKTVDNIETYRPSVTPPRKKDPSEQPEWKRLLGEENRRLRAKDPAACKTALSPAFELPDNADGGNHEGEVHVDEKEASPGAIDPDKPVNSHDEAEDVNEQESHCNEKYSPSDYAELERARAVASSQDDHDEADPEVAVARMSVGARVPVVVTVKQSQPQYRPSQCPFLDDEASEDSGLDLDRRNLVAASEKRDYPDASHIPANDDASLDAEASIKDRAAEKKGKRKRLVKLAHQESDSDSSTEFEGESVHQTKRTIDSDDEEEVTGPSEEEKEEVLADKPDPIETKAESECQRFDQEMIDEHTALSASDIENINELNDEESTNTEEHGDKLATASLRGMETSNLKRKFEESDENIVTPHKPEDTAMKSSETTAKRCLKM